MARCAVDDQPILRRTKRIQRAFIAARCAEVFLVEVAIFGALKTYMWTDPHTRTFKICDAKFFRRSRHVWRAQQPETCAEKKGVRACSVQIKDLFAEVKYPATTVRVLRMHMPGRTAVRQTSTSISNSTTLPKSESNQAVSRGGLQRCNTVQHAATQHNGLQHCSAGSHQERRHHSLSPDPPKKRSPPGNLDNVEACLEVETSPAPFHTLPNILGPACPSAAT